MNLAPGQYFREKTDHPANPSEGEGTWASRNRGDHPRHGEVRVRIERS
jgi:hypothetical protein